jgi:NADH dehydrogenase/NADH:ubiquinone oxidoreductase subunit G
MRRLAAHRARGPAPPAPQVTIIVDGAPVEARAGEALLAALLAAGHPVLWRSARRDEPRGGFCYAGQCLDCWVVVDGQANTPACRTPVRAGMVVETQRGWR